MPERDRGQPQKPCQ